MNELFIVGIIFAILGIAFIVFGVCLIVNGKREIRKAQETIKYFENLQPKRKQKQPLTLRLKNIKKT